MINKKKIVIEKVELNLLLTALIKNEIRPTTDKEIEYLAWLIYRDEIESKLTKQQEHQLIDKILQTELHFRDKIGLCYNAEWKCEARTRLKKRFSKKKKKKYRRRVKKPVNAHK